MALVATKREKRKNVCVEIYIYVCISIRISVCERVYLRGYKFVTTCKSPYEGRERERQRRYTSCGLCTAESATGGLDCSPARTVQKVLCYVRDFEEKPVSTRVPRTRSKATWRERRDLLHLSRLEVAAQERSVPALAPPQGETHTESIIITAIVRVSSGLSAYTLRPPVLLLYLLQTYGTPQ